MGFLKCASLSSEPPRVDELRFTDYDIDKTIGSIDPRLSVIMLRGRVWPTEVSYTVFWRFNGVTVSEHPLSLATDSEHPADEIFKLPLAIRPDGTGLYTAGLVMRRTSDSGAPACIVATKAIVHLDQLRDKIPDPLSDQEAVAEYEQYYDPNGLGNATKARWRG